MRRTDFHTHTMFSPDSKTPLDALIETAKQRGVTDLAITDHMDFNLKNRSLDWAVEFPRYAVEVGATKEQYRGRINVHLGMELGMQPAALDLMAEAVSKADFDFIIGSLHSVQEYDIYYDEFYADKSPEQAANAYFDDFIVCVENFHDYCVLGHLDLFYRYKEPMRRVAMSSYAGKLDHLLRTIIADDKGIEINTAGRRYGLPSFHPHWPIVARYHELGGRIITIGSDAHRADDVGYGFDDVIRGLRDIGFDHICTFERRNPVFHSIKER